MHRDKTIFFANLCDYVFWGKLDYLGAMKTKATLKNISDMLQISISTVSRALKDHPDIAEATKKKVRELAEMMDYEPNAFAVYLRTNNSRLLGLIVPEISNYFYHSLIAAAEEEARKLGYSLMILQSGNNAETEAANLRLCKLNRVAGIMVALSGSDKQDMLIFERLEETGIPVVFFDKVPDQQGFSTVSLADEQAGELAATALLQKPRSQVLAILGDPQLSITRKRQKAFLQTCKRMGSAKAPRTVHAHTRAEAYEAVKQAFAKKEQPDALFCMSDEILTGAMQALHELGIAYPDTLGVIAISNGFFPGLYNPVISYVETSADQLGRVVFRSIIDRIVHQSLPREEIIEARLVEGKSL